MFYFLSRIIWVFFQPSTFLVLLGSCGIILLLTRWKKWGLRLMVLAFAGLLIAGLSPLGQVLILPLEERFSIPPPDAPAPDGIIILGGSLDTRVSSARGVVALNEAGERQVLMTALALRYPDAKIVFSGGGGGHLAGDMNESDVIKRFMELTGYPAKRVILEDRSLNTWQNAKYARALVNPAQGEKWFLVTSAAHMPRAVGCFRQAGFDVVAYPVDFRTQGYQDVLKPFKSVSEGLRRVDAAFREWVGLTIYWLTGRSSAFFPAP